MPRLAYSFDTDIKPHVGAGHISNSLETLEAYIEQAWHDFLKPVLSAAFLEELDNAYRGNTLTTAQESVLGFVQRALFNYAYFLLAQDGNLQIDDGGFNANETSTFKRPYQWQMRDFKQNRLKMAWNSLEEAQRYMEANSGDYGTWWDSDERKANWAYFFSDSYSFRQFKIINGFGTFRALFPFLERAVSYHLCGLLGADFVEDLKGKFVAGTLSADEKKLLPYMRDYLAHMAIVLASEDIPFHVTEQGIYLTDIQENNQNTDKYYTPSSEQMLRLRAMENELAIGASGRIVAYLDRVATADLFTAYYNSELYQAEVNANTPDPELYTGGTFML